MKLSLLFVLSALQLLAYARPHELESPDPIPSRGDDAGDLGLNHHSGRDNSQLPPSRCSRPDGLSVGDSEVWVHTKRPGVELCDCDIVEDCDCITVPENTAIALSCKFEGRNGMFYKNEKDGRYVADKDVNPPKPRLPFSLWQEYDRDRFNELRSCTVGVVYKSDKYDDFGRLQREDENGAPGTCLPGDRIQKELNQRTLYAEVRGFGSSRPPSDVTVFCKLYRDALCNEEIPDLRLGGHCPNRWGQRRIPDELGWEVKGYRCW